MPEAQRSADEARSRRVSRFLADAERLRPQMAGRRASETIQSPGLQGGTFHAPLSCRPSWVTLDFGTLP